MAFPGYEILEELSRNDWHMLHRGRRHEDGRPVLLKVPANGPLRAAAVEGLEREHEILLELQEFSIPGIVRAYEVLRDGEARCLVLEDVGALPLEVILGQNQPNLQRFFELGVQLSAILAELHRRQITHGNISPQSIFVHPSRGEVSLTDFSLAERRAGETRAPEHPQILRDRLAYVSPEQTGRMNRAIDYRTDFYSLGVTFYELLTGTVPFRSHDWLELIHWHIAKRPPAPREIDARIPEPLSRIVMKLLSKTAEERYQSALGLKADLEICARAWAAENNIAAFPLGRRDVPDRFLIPQKLYGRDRELEVLLRAFDDTCTGRSALMLVAGYSGIGKTSLIQELYKPIVRQRGYFTAGKFDQVVRNIPFGALIQAFRGLVLQLLTESEDRLVTWRGRLVDALGTGASVLAQVLPEITLIVGEQPPPPPLGSVEARNRFQLVFQNFLGALARKDHPLVVFLDDLQWADPATLGLFQPLLTSPEEQCLLLIGAYRDNEVYPAHPLLRTVEALDAADVRLPRIYLGPLQLPDLSLLVSDTLWRELSDIEPLAGLVLDKTAGNPFFVIQFLKTLRQEGLLAFDYARGHWTFRMDSIVGAAMTDNVIDLMIGKIQRLAPATQRALRLAACVGGQFGLDTVATVSENSVEGAAADLKEAIDEGLILPGARSSSASAAADSGGLAPTLATYAFLHDRVQQAAYALIRDDDKALMHLTVGRLLLERWIRDQAPEKIFDIVGHLNIGRALLVNAAERLAVARLNLEAGGKAKTSTAYDAASGYLDQGIALLSDDHWASDYELMFSLHLEAAECHYLARRFDVAEDYFGLLLARALTPLDKAQVHALRIILYENLSHYHKAVSSGREGLSLFGILLPERAEDAQAALDAEIDAIQRLLGDRTIASLIDLPAMTDANVRMVMGILTSLWSPAYISGNQLVARLISATMVRLSLAHGNTEDSAYGYVTHAITIGPMRGDYSSAYEWGELALKVNDRFGDTKRRAKIHQQFHAHVKLWRQPFKTCIPHAREARRSGLEAGDLNYAGYGAVTETWPALPIANDLDRFVREYEPAASLLEKLKLSDFLTALRVMLNWALALQGRTATRLSLSNARFDEGAFLAKFENEPFFRTFFYTAKLHLCVLLEEIELGLEAARRARQGTLAGTIWPVLVDFWGGLALTGAFGTASNEDRVGYWDQLRASQESLRVLADNCPENYRCFWLLLSAEMNRISSQQDEAVRLCKEAIAYTRQTDNLQQEALANELCAKALLPRSGESAAAAFLIEAHRCYAAWGASVKVQQMEEKYGHLLAARPASATAESPAVLQSTTGQVASLDVSTVLKAAHAIASEIQLDDLLRKLMTIALENAGAQRGFFLRDRDGRLVVEAEGTADGESVIRRAPLEEVSRLSSGVVRYVRKTGQSVVLGDAKSDERFGQDPYIASAHPRSILCVPAVHQGKLEGILYLENNLATDAFTADRIKVLDILCSQAAISLENARLYDEMKQEAIQRRRAEEMLRALTEGTASATGSDFFQPLVRHLASALEVRYAFVAECRDKTRTRAKSLAFWKGDGFGENFEYDVVATPCKEVLDGRMSHHAEHVQDLFSDDHDLVELGAESYLGAPIFDASAQVIGHLAVLNDRPMPEDRWRTAVLRIFAARAGAELERLRAEEEISALNMSLAAAAERSRTLLEINNAVISNLTQDALLHAISQALRRVIPFERSAIFLHDPKKDVLRLIAFESSRPSDHFVVGRLEIPARVSHLGAFRHQQYLLRRDLEKERRYPTEDLLFGEGFRSLIIVPLTVRGTLIGSLFVASERHSHYTEAGAEFLREVANQVALAVANMVAFEEIAGLKARLERENVYLQEEIRDEHNFDEMVGSSPVLLDVLRRVERVAPTDAAVLIYGETGTGKELIARAIHSRSARKSRPLVKVNCGAISAGLVESELFGHVKGAFTGAIERRVGRFELADGGTLFLDEVSELPLETQVKLLRVLQEHEFEPVGSSKTVRVNVRIIAATNRDLQEAVRTGRFRSDLFFRLNVVPIHVPQLRERPSDIARLVTFFLSRFSRQFGKKIDAVSNETMERLRNYPWPGNIRELQNVIERAVVMADQPVLSLGPDLLPATEAAAVRVVESDRAALPAVAGAISSSAPVSLEEIERRHIQAVLEQTQGVIEGPRGAAKILSLHPNTLRSRMKKLGVQRPSQEMS